MKNAIQVLELLANQHSRDTQIIKIQESDILSECTDDSSKTHKLTSKNKKSIVIDNEDIRLIIKKVFDDSYLKSALSENFSDVLEVFNQITELIGEIDFVFAVLFNCIYEDKLWESYGYNSLESFLNDLPSGYRISRQTFITTANAGRVIQYLRKSIKGSSEDSYYLTPKLLYRNYSKIKFLYRIKYVWGLEITYDILVNFRDMKFRDFNNFVNEYKELHKYQIKQRYHRKSFLTKESKDENYFLRGRPFSIDKLTDLDLEIYKKVRLGYIVEYIYSTNPVFIDSVIKYLQEAYNDDYVKEWSYFELKISLEGQQDTILCGVDLVNYVPDNLGLTVENITENYLNLSPNNLRKAFIEKYKNKTELILAQASLIYIIEHNEKLHSSIVAYFKKNKIECQSDNLEIDFAINVLDLTLSYYKWLKRLGNSIPYIRMLRNVDDFTGSFLEKLSYLRTAFNCHSENPQLITDAFIILSAKRFRKFASDKNDDLSHELINRCDYQKAKSLIIKLNVCKSSGRAITAITLKSEKQKKCLYDINQIIEKKDIKLMKNYPEIDWDSEFHAIIERETIREAIREKYQNKYKHKGIEGFVTALCEEENEINKLEGNLNRY